MCAKVFIIILSAEGIDSVAPLQLSSPPGSACFGDQECYSIEEVLGGLRGGAWGVIGQGRDPGGKHELFSPMTYIHIKTDRAWPLGRVTSHQNRSRTAL